MALPTLCRACQRALPRLSSRSRMSTTTTQQFPALRHQQPSMLASVPCHPRTQHGPLARRAFTTSLPQRFSRTMPASTPSPSEEEAAAAVESSMTPTESSIAAVLSEHLSPTSVLVQDISGGCGSMYAIDITSDSFRGLSMLKQQRMVNAALGELVKGWHGVQIRTRVPEA